jgi:hypothetical protein
LIIFCLLKSLVISRYKKLSVSPKVQSRFLEESKSKKKNFAGLANSLTFSSLKFHKTTPGFDVGIIILVRNTLHNIEQKVKKLRIGKHSKFRS